MKRITAAVRAGRISVCGALAMPAALLAAPALPVIPTGTFTVAAATGNAATDTANIKAALASAKTAGGGTVVVPAGTYLANTLTLSSGIDLQLSAGCTIQNATPANTLVQTSGTLHDVEITGTGTLDGRATAVSSSNLINLTSTTRLAVTGVTIANASHEHLVTTNDTQLTIDGVKINDAYSVAQTGAYLANTDGIDFSGTHVLIQNVTVNDGDDDIAAKPSGTATSDVLITNNTIGAGHGISVGGQTNAGLDGMTVSHCTFTNTDNGLRLKAGPGQGGVVKNVSFSDITMTGVDHPLIINSWYQDGDRYGSAQVSGSSLHKTTNPGETLMTVNQSNNTDLNPFFDNIAYTNITATGGAENVAILYGLDSAPAVAGDPARNIDTVSFNNVNLTGAYGADLYYISNLDTTGLTVHTTASGAAAINAYGNSVPEPAGLMCGVASLLVMGRRARRL